MVERYPAALGSNLERAGHDGVQSHRESRRKASALGIEEQGAQPVLETLGRALRGRSLLLVIGALLSPRNARVLDH